MILSQRLVTNVCKEFFAPELPWRDISSGDVDKARDAVEEGDSLLEGRPDIVHWLIAKYQRSASHMHVRWESLLHEMYAGS